MANPFKQIGDWVTSSGAWPEPEKSLEQQKQEIEQQISKKPNPEKLQQLKDSYFALLEKERGASNTKADTDFAASSPVTDFLRRKSGVKFAGDVMTGLGEGAAAVMPKVAPAVVPMFTGRPYDAAATAGPPKPPAPPVTPDMSAEDRAANAAWKTQFFADLEGGANKAGGAPPMPKQENEFLDDLKRQRLQSIAQGASAPVPGQQNANAQYQDFLKANPFPSQPVDNGASWRAAGAAMMGGRGNFATKLGAGAGAWNTSEEARQKQDHAYNLAKYGDAANRFSTGLGMQNTDAQQKFAAESAPYAARAADLARQMNIDEHGAVVQAHQNTADRTAQWHAAALGNKKPSDLEIKNKMAIEAEKLMEQLRTAPEGQKAMLRARLKHLEAMAKLINPKTETIPAEGMKELYGTVGGYPSGIAIASAFGSGNLDPAVADEELIKRKFLKPRE